MRIAGVLIVTAALAGCGSIADLNPFGEKDQHLVGDRETVFSTNTEMMSADSMRSATVGPVRSNNDWPQPGGNAQNDPGHLAFSGGGTRHRLRDRDNLSAFVAYVF